MNNRRNTAWSSVTPHTCARIGKKARPKTMPPSSVIPCPVLVSGIGMLWRSCVSTCRLADSSCQLGGLTAMVIFTLSAKTPSRSLWKAVRVCVIAPPGLVPSRTPTQFALQFSIAKRDVFCVRLSSLLPLIQFVCKPVWFGVSCRCTVLVQHRVPPGDATTECLCLQWARFIPFNCFLVLFRRTTFLNRNAFMLSPEI